MMGQPQLHTKWGHLQTELQWHGVSYLALSWLGFVCSSGLRQQGFPLLHPLLPPHVPKHPTHTSPPKPVPLRPPLCSCPAAASSPRNVGEASFLRKALGAFLLLPPCLVSPGFSFLSSHPCSSFLPFDVPPLLCSRAGAACQVEVSAPHPTISCDRRFSFSLTPCSMWPGSQHHHGQQSPAVCPSRWWDQPQAGPSSQGSSTSALLQGTQGCPGLTLYRWLLGWHWLLGCRLGS